MVIVDFSHLSMRNLYVAISQAKPRKENGVFVTDDFIQFYYHLMLQSLRHISSKFDDYGEIILALDSKNNWRKDFYPDYKGHRKKGRDDSDVDFETFFKKVEEFGNILDENFPYTILQVEKAEADDIIGILSEKFGAIENIMVVSSDKDFKQILEFGANLYDPIKKEHIRMSKEELKEWKLIHILCGDDGDNIPHIKRMTQFTDNFKAYLKKNEIYLDDVEKFNELSISKKLYSEYDVYKVNKKGEVQDELDIFKATPFGPAGAKKFIVDLKENLRENKLYADHFKRNMKLVLFSQVPNEIREKILEAFQNKEHKYNPDGIMKFLSAEHLTTQLMNITDFYVDSKKHEEGAGMREWV
jgi:5'-3' exonuclease